MCVRLTLCIFVFLQSYWTSLCYWAYQSSVIFSPYVAIDQIFRRMNLSALVLHLTWAVPDIFASCVSNGIHSVSIKYTSLFNTEYFLHPPVSRSSEYGISRFEIYERPLHRVRVDNDRLWILSLVNLQHIRLSVPNSPLSLNPFNPAIMLKA